MTRDEIAGLRAKHADHAGCDAARLLAEIDHREANPPTWQGRRHRSPVPHLVQFAPGAWTEQPVTGAQHARWMAEHDAGIGYGLLGPGRSEELPHGT